MLAFTCNVCEAPCSVHSRDHLRREEKTCHACGSTVRFRWIVYALSTQLFGRSVPLPQFPRRKQVRGVGMSDWERIAAAFAEKFTYVNTFFDVEPKLDLLAPRAQDWGAYDFVVCSEVFEHITPPVTRAFAHLRRLLRPGGVVVFSVPWLPDGETVEHFPALHDWGLVTLSSGIVLVNRTSEGGLETFDNLIFHGGPGQTLEMRVFSKSGLSHNLKEAGFEEVRFASDDECLEHGIVFQGRSAGVVAR